MIEAERNMLFKRKVVVSDLSRKDCMEVRVINTSQVTTRRDFILMNCQNE